VSDYAEDPFVRWRAGLDMAESGVKEIEGAQVDHVCAHLVTLQDIADAWKMSVGAVNMARYRNANFPTERAQFGRTLVFWAPDVDEFMRGYVMARATREKP
jgi:hypothetical protein